MTRPAGETRFLLLYALANAGAMVAYVPLLTLVFPARIAALAGSERVVWLGFATLAGAVTAGLANILWGHASDRRGTRRGWVAAGLVTTLASYALLAAATTPATLVAAVIVFQIALNLLLAPLAAWAADRVPDDRKGVLGGLLGAGPAAGALAGVAATAPGLTAGGGLGVVAVLVMLLVTPLLIASTGVSSAPAHAPIAAARIARRDLALLWVARLLVQVAAAVLFAFLLFYFQSLPQAPGPYWVAKLNALALALGFPLALVVGRASDRIGPRRPFLIGAAVAMAAGLAIMAGAGAGPAAAAGYLLFGCGLSVFLPLHATFAMQLLPRPDRYGRDLGVLNLANTVPLIVATGLTAGLVPHYGYGVLLAGLAGGVAVGGGCIAFVRCDRQATRS